MKIYDYIRSWFVRPGSILFDQRAQAFFDGWGLTSHNFAELIWYNITDLLTDLAEDVKLEDATGAGALTDSGAKFAAFRAFFYAWGKTVLQRLFDEGYVVIGYHQAKGIFFQMQQGTDYFTTTEGELTTVKPTDINVVPYVMKSSAFISRGKSDRAICKGWLDYLDDVLNGSATVCRRLGVVVMASPKNLNSSPTAIVLTKEQKEALEKQMREDYGMLNKQSNLMLLPREMNAQVINLAGLELKTAERVKTAILTIVDRIKIPANQVAIIDAQSSKQLANGGEIREGDKLKYKTFRRLFERTWVEMATSYGIRFTYAIDGEPIGDNGGEVVAE